MWVTLRAGGSLAEARVSRSLPAVGLGPPRRPGCGCWPQPSTCRHLCALLGTGHPELLPHHRGGCRRQLVQRGEAAAAAGGRLGDPGWWEVGGRGGGAPRWAGLADRERRRRRRDAAGAAAARAARWAQQAGLLSPAATLCTPTLPHAWPLPEHVRSPSTPPSGGAWAPRWATRWAHPPSGWSTSSATAPSRCGGVWLGKWWWWAVYVVCLVMPRSRSLCGSERAALTD